MNPLSELVIFEMANNHEGSVSHARRIIDVAARVAGRFGLRAGVKLQYRDLDTLVHPSFRTRQDVPHIQRFVRTALSKESLRDLVRATQDGGLLSVVTAFDERSVDLALEHGVDVLKIASCSSTDWPLISHIANSSSLPTICSTGGTPIEQLDYTVGMLAAMPTRPLAVMHCVGLYPAPPEALCLSFIRTLARRYPSCLVGYSGHEAPDDLTAVVAAVALGATVLERHVGIPSNDAPLNAYSLDADAVARWVDALVCARTVVGTGERRNLNLERQTLAPLTRGQWARDSVAVGEPMTDKTFCAIPLQEFQTPAGAASTTQLATREYKALDPIFEPTTVRPEDELWCNFQHAKALLAEAGLRPSERHQVELSHHYGRSQFARFGAVIITMVNQAYCKKLIVLLPGQEHPAHRHPRQETLAVLSGYLTIRIDDRTTVLAEGDSALIESNMVHGFRSEHGCVIEELTLHYEPGTTIYEDATINECATTERKTDYSACSGFGSHQEMGRG